MEVLRNTNTACFFVADFTDFDFYLQEEICNEKNKKWIQIISASTTAIHSVIDM